MNRSHSVGPPLLHNTSVAFWVSSTKTLQERPQRNPPPLDIETGSLSHQLLCSPENSGLPRILPPTTHSVVGGQKWSPTPFLRGVGVSWSCVAPQIKYPPQVTSFLGPWHSHPRCRGQSETQRASQWPQHSAALSSVPRKVSGGPTVVARATQS